MTQLAKITEPSAEIVPLESASLLEVISRAAADPNTDVDKLERLLGMYERINDRQAQYAFDQAMSAAQEEMRRIAADANNPQTRSKYASYAALDRELRPIYTRHGFSLSFYQGDDAPQDMVRVACRVARAGHAERPHLDMPADGKGAKGGDVMTKTHATGAAITYGKRYLLGMIFNIAIGEDRDGNDSPREAGAMAKRAITDINALTTIEGLKAWRGTNETVLKDMDENDRRHVVQAFNDRLRRMKEAAQ